MEKVLDVDKMDENMSIWSTYGSELAGDFGMKLCGRPTVWGQDRCERHKVERRAGAKDRRKEEKDDLRDQGT